MTQDEFASWMAYRQRHGPLDPTERMDTAIAGLCELVAAAAGLKSRSGQPLDREKFMPYLVPAPLADTVDNLAKLMRGENT